MLLAIDAGNTNTVFAVLDGDRTLDSWRITTNDSRTADEYMVWLSQLMGLKGIDAGGINDVIISTVVPQALFNLRRLATHYFNVDPLVVGTDGVDIGMDIRVDRPGEVGADRLVNAIAAYHLYGGPLIVIDSGTATTFDVVSDDGAYEGGVIAPGMNLSLEALHSAAAKLPRIAVERPRSSIGKGTVEAMQSGVYWGYIGLVEGLVARIKKDYGKPMKVVATGGLAMALRDGTDVFDELNNDLTVLGLSLIAARNRGAETVSV